MINFFKKLKKRFENASLIKIKAKLTELKSIYMKNGITQSLRSCGLSKSGF
jgi:hypothetical protein